MPNDNAYYQRTYGITTAEYEAQAEYQNDRCAICQEPNPALPSGVVRRLSVDHDHLTGENRELLCDRCNKVLGFLSDDRNLLLKMDRYLERFGKVLMESQ
jgi:hypothetical protein